jgi:hypothetical protein
MAVLEKTPTLFDFLAEKRIVPDFVHDDLGARSRKDDQ